MSIEDATRFVSQCQELDWHPEIFIIGGEPTLHSDFFRFIEIANAVSHRVVVCSNGFSEDSRKKLARIRSENLCRIEESTIKAAGSVVHGQADLFLAPIDYGNDRREPCPCHSARGSCGISVDAGGYTVCPCGGAIDGVLGLGVRAKRLVDLFDAEFATEQTQQLCRRCGAFTGVDRQRLEKATMRDGTLFSPTWFEAVKSLGSRLHD
jgi:hypothetical protein